MSNYQSATFNDRELGNLPELRRQHERTVAVEALKQQGTGSGNALNTTGRYIISEGQHSDQSFSSYQSATISAADTNLIYVNGIQTSREVLKTMIEAGSVIPGRDRIQHSSGQLMDPLSLRSFSEGTDSLGLQDSSHDQSNEDNTDDADGEGNDQQPEVDYQTQVAFAEGQQALDGLRTEFGANNVERAMTEAAISGNYEVPGVEASRTASVVSAYTAMSDSSIASTGIDSDLAGYCLDAQDLTHMRLSVITRDANKLMYFANKAADTLALMPDRDPARFAQVMEERFPGVVAFQDESGRTWVDVNGRSEPWASLVRRGTLLRLGK